MNNIEVNKDVFNQCLADYMKDINLYDNIYKRDDRLRKNEIILGAVIYYGEKMKLKYIDGAYNYAFENLLSKEEKANIKEFYGTDLYYAILRCKQVFENITTRFSDDFYNNHMKTILDRYLYNVQKGEILSLCEISEMSFIQDKDDVLSGLEKYVYKSNPELKKSDAIKLVRELDKLKGDNKKAELPLDKSNDHSRTVTSKFTAKEISDNSRKFNFKKIFEKDADRYFKIFKDSFNIRAYGIEQPLSYRTCNTDVFEDFIYSYETDVEFFKSVFFKLARLILNDETYGEPFIYTLFDIMNIFGDKYNYSATRRNYSVFVPPLMMYFILLYKRNKLNLKISSDLSERVFLNDNLLDFSEEKMNSFLDYAEMRLKDDEIDSLNQALVFNYADTNKINGRRISFSYYIDREMIKLLAKKIFEDLFADFAKYSANLE